VKLIKKLITALVYSSIYLSLGGTLVTYSFIKILELNLKIEPLLYTFVCVFFFYNINRHTDIKEDRINHPARTEFTEKYGQVLFLAGLFSFVFIIIYNLLISRYNVALSLIIPLFIVGIYSLGVPKFKRIKNRLLLKDIAVAIGWSFIILLISSYYLIVSSELIILGLFLFIQILITTIAFDIKDIEGDLMNGIITLPNAYGINKTKNILYLLNLLTLLIIIVSVYFGFAKNILYLSIIPIYSIIYTYILPGKNPHMLCEIFVDGQYILIGILTALLL
jgi:4-hydroxybenzoate polyprenyltransferase